MTASAGVLRFGMGERRQPGLGRSFVLAFVVHGVLFSAMFLGVRWQSHDPEVVTVELWEAPPPPPPPVVKPEPKVEAPKPEPAPPPPVVAKPEPKLEKPDITIKDREKPKPKPKPKPEPKKAEAKKPEPPKRDLEFERRLREQAAAEQQVLAEQQRIAEAQRRDRELKELIARQQAAARTKAVNAWMDQIRRSVRRNIVYPVDEMQGNPAAVFYVTLLPTGEVLSVVQRRSSGNAGYDRAVETAIHASSPLPKPDDRSVFDRELELTFRPKDQ